MKIQILQGINFESPYSTIKAEFDQNPDIKVIEDLAGLHRVFLKAYSNDQNSVIVQTKLTHLWIEIFKTLDKQSKGELTIEDARRIIFETIIKNQILSMSTIPILDAADQKNLEITQYFVGEGIIEKPQKYFNRYYCLGCGQYSHIFVSYSSSNDSHLGQKVQKDKLTSNIIFDRLGLPVAKWQLVESREQLKEIFDDFPKPCVIKPTGLVGGSGVSTGINTIEQAIAAYVEAQNKINGKDRPSWQTLIMIQKQVEGEDFRILVIGGKARFATKRVPAYVIGDGEHNIKQLIEILNNDPRRDILNPLHTLKPVIFDEMLDIYLSEKGLTFDTVPSKNERVRIRKPASMSQGGITEDVTEIVHPQIMQIAETLAESIHVHTLGVDVYCKDITQPLTAENGTILEMNTMPEGYLNAFPAIGKQCPEVGHIFIDALFSDRKPADRIVVIGWDGQDIEKLHSIISNNSAKEKIGVYYQGQIFVDKNLMTSSMTYQKAVEAIKLNASLSKVVLAFSNTSEAKEYGLGFDQIDRLIILKENANITEADMQILRSYSAEGRIGKIEMS